MSNEKKILIVIGSAPGALDEVNAFLARRIEDGPPTDEGIDYLAVGMDAVEFPSRLGYLATYHPGDIGQAKNRRAKMGGNLDYQVICYKQHEKLVDIIIPFEHPSGSSSLLGALAGLKLGYKKIVLCGCPLAGIGAKDQNYETFRPGWEKKYNQVKDAARSMSGWTRQLLGAPDTEWLKNG